MNRSLAAPLFILASLVGGPIVVSAASFAVVNFVRGVLIFLPAIFDLSDFRFMIHLIPLAISLAVIYGVFLGTTWLARRAIYFGETSIAAVAAAQRGRAWMNILLTLFVASLSITLIIGFGFGMEYSQQLFTLFLEGAFPQAFGLVLVIGAYIPFGMACFAMAAVVVDLPFPNGRTPPSATIGLFLSPLALVVWIIGQWATGGLF